MELSDEQKQAIEQQKVQCPFCKIIKGEIPSKKVYEDEKVIGILDKNTATKGHILLMPKEHYPIMPLIPQETFQHLAKITKNLVGCAKKATLTQGATVFIANGGAAGQQTSHFMLHIVPREQGDQLSNFDLADNHISKVEIDKIYEPLKSNLAIMMRNHLQRMGKKIPEAPKMTKEELMKLIEANPQIKELMLKDVEGFKKMIPTNPQLQTLFKDVDVDDIVKTLKGDVKEEEKTKSTEEKKESIEQSVGAERAEPTEVKKEEPVEEKKKEDSTKQEEKVEEKDIISKLKQIIEKNPELADQIKEDPKKVLELLKNSKYKEETEGVTEEDLKAAIEEDKIDLDNLVDTFK